MDRHQAGQEGVAPRGEDMKKMPYIPLLTAPYYLFVGHRE